ncbi:MAG TPA: hypothetical protein VGB17_04675 [Pyrinomonadaceae bacterium]|jgi:hypothetical protein
MSQLRALIWLKWRLFRNGLRSRKAVANRAASLLTTLLMLALALGSAIALGVIAFFMVAEPEQVSASESGTGPAGISFFFMIFTMIYLAWGLVPMSMGSGSQFDPGRLLLYPISLRKLFIVDLLSELTSTASVYAVPAVLGATVGAGLASGKLLLALCAGLCAIALGIVLAKWLGTSIGSLMRRRRTRGETLVALVGAVVGLAGAFLGQFAEVMMRHGASFRALRWTPPGAIALALTEGLQPGGTGAYALSLLTLLMYISVLTVLTYLIARRSALGMGGASRSTARTRDVKELEGYAGWQLPLVSPELSAVIEKEWRYAVRNAQLRMMALMPLILIAIRLARSSSLARGNGQARVRITPQAGSFSFYTDGLVVAAGLLYVFLLLSSLGFNLFAYEGAGMRSLVLSPLERRTILLGKNLVVTALALILATILLLANQLIFRDLSTESLLFAGLCFPLFAAVFALVGNWFSMRFPKRLEFGKKMKAAGMSGLLMIPILLGMMLLPLLAVCAGYLAQSLLLKYVTLLSLAGVSIMLYFRLVNGQGQALARRELEILEAVGGKTED